MKKKIHEILESGEINLNQVQFLKTTHQLNYVVYSLSLYHQNALIVKI